MFDDVYEKKESGLGRIHSRLARVRKILIDLQQPGSAVAIFDPQFSPEEQPEQLLTVHDAEITVEKYLSPAQLAELEAKRVAEEERKRRERLDNWRERGLEEMMGGVLEIRKEDELKKDVPKPAFLLTGKPLGHWTEDDKRLYAEYERKVKELNEEREKYRKVCR
ncbi:WD repeat-containing protein 96 [Fasciolopsis buskii]|uniref:WD repeat-containing protein 96 n=1 Tax=Fasciolopsis buskii TaxID=27845 RepID=A0A8E0RW96_9TREM|nr:WD repeat-containing protein 96 [Fasciolopsis buski]